MADKDDLQTALDALGKHASPAARQAAIADLTARINKVVAANDWSKDPELMELKAARAILEAL